MGSRERLFLSAQIAEQAELYEDMAKTIRELVMITCEAKQPLIKEERNFLSVAFKNVVGSRRSAWRIINTVAQKQEGSIAAQATVYKEKIAEEIRGYCNDVIVGVKLKYNIYYSYLCVFKQYIIGKLLEVIEDPRNDDTKDEQYVFYVKMKGDYYRYLSEVNQGTDREGKTSVSECLKAWLVTC